MFKKYFILIFLFFISISIFAQKENPRKYFNNVNKAELAIIDSNYQGACEYYKKAFKYLNEPFGKDISNLLRCAFRINDSIALRFCCVKFKERAYDDSYYIKQYGNFKLMSYWRFLMQTIDLKPTLNVKFIRKLNELERKDQSIRNKISSPEEYLELDNNNIKLLYSYMKENNVYLGENIVGNDTKINEENGELAGKDYGYFTGFILLWHYAKSPLIKNLEPINLNLKDEVMMGHFCPITYSSLCEQGYGFDGSYDLYYSNMYGTSNAENYMAISLTSDTVNIVYKIVKGKKLKDLNKRRKKIYLYSHQDYIKRIKCMYKQRKNRNFDFNFGLTFGYMFI
jgi:hypothetical protein